MAIYAVLQLLIVFGVFESFAVDNTCKLESIIVPSSGSKMAVDLSHAKCIILNARISSAFEGTKDDMCSWANVFFNKKTGCPRFYRRMMIPFERQITLRNNRLISHPLFLLHICRIGGAFNKPYEPGGTCAVENREIITAETTQYLLTRQGVPICRELRVKAIERCSHTHDPLSPLQNTKRSSLLCAQKFKHMLHTSVERQNLGRITVSSFTNAEAKLLMPELVEPFGLEKKEKAQKESSNYFHKKC